jgi:hypothetical protein
MKKSIFIFILFFSNFCYANPYTQKFCKQINYENNNFICLQTKNIKSWWGLSWEQIFPDERERKIFMHINRTNKKITKHSLIITPKKLCKNKTYMDFSPFPKYID